MNCTEIASVCCCFLSKLCFCFICTEVVVYIQMSYFCPNDLIGAEVCRGRGFRFYVNYNKLWKVYN